MLLSEATTTRGEKILRFAAGAVLLAAGVLLVLQRRRPIPLPPFLTFLLENPVTERFVGERLLLERLRLAPGMRVLDAEGLTNVRTLGGGLGEGALDEGGFDRVVLVMVIGEVRDRASALRELHAALEPGGILSVTEAVGDPE